MNFVHLEFAYFLFVVVAAYWLVHKRELQNLVLLAASAVFYGWVHPWFLWLLYGSATLDYLVGRGMQRWPTRRKRLLMVSMAGNLGLLGYFKYCDFFIENVNAALALIGLNPSIQTLGVFLPVGISFYTFQTMSYTVDLYRGEVEPRRNYLDYLVFVSFFPQLVAGPVERAASLLKQVEAERTLTWEGARAGVSLAMWGLFKKVVIADTIAPYVDRIFVLQSPTQGMVVAGTIGFAIQILADFSGYTDIARGVSRLLGFELVLNFRNPYLATTPSDFWRRWHISFSTWIRDYLYIPLGGSRGTFARMTAATFGAMLLSGLWHGASWNFVLWGAYHALLITGYRLVMSRIPERARSWRLAPIVTVTLMFGFTCFGWLIFRETHIERLGLYLSDSAGLGTQAQLVVTLVMLAMCVLCAAPLVVGLMVERFVVPRLRASALFLPLETSTWGLQAYAVLIFVRTTPDAFIYFQF